MDSNTCSVNDCGRPVLNVLRQLCQTHYTRWRKTGDVQADIPIQSYKPKDGRTCIVPLCGRPIRRVDWCEAHYARLLTHGDVRADVPVQYHAPRGNGHIEANGYKRFGSKGTRTEHRLVMEQVLGRELLPNEHIHHLNGVRHDNRPENLELWTVNHPKGQRVSDLLAWAHELITMYED